MQFRILHPADDTIDSDLKKKALHYVGFAELGFAFFRSYLMFAFNYKLDEALRLCETINREDETGTIYPRGYMTGLPVRFFRSPLNHSNINQFRSCLRDAFVANRDYCKSQEMVFDYRCDISNRDEIIDETIQMANEINDDPILKMVTILADNASACTALQRTVFDDYYSLGMSYYNGDGVLQDYKEAVKWYKLAAEQQGNESAQNSLGLMYRKGQGVTQDDKEALKWFRLAAAQGDADAQFNLGDMGINNK